MDGKRQWLLLFAFVFLLGCGSPRKQSSGPIRWASLPVVLYADPAITSSTTTQSDLNEAMSFWESRAGRKLFDFRGAWTGQNPPYTGDAGRPDNLLGNVIYFERSWPFAANIAAQTVVFSQSSDLLSSVIMLNPNINLCAGDCASQSGTSERRVFAHELGHFLGLQHNSNVADIMYPELQPGHSLQSLQIDSAALSQLTR